MNNGTDLSQLYDLRKKFTIIALTGRTGSGASKIAEQISKGFIKEEFPNPYDPRFDLNNNSFKKYRIVHKFAEKNFKPFDLIFYRDVLTLFILKYEFSEFLDFITSEQINKEIEKYKRNDLKEFFEKDSLLSLKKNFDEIKKERDSVRRERGNTNYNNKLSDFFASQDFKKISKELHNTLKERSFAKHNIIMQIIADNLRRSGEPYNSLETGVSKIFTIADIILKIMKGIRITKPKNPTKIVIDSLRNPFEIMFFRQRYCSFYLIAVNKDDKSREERLKSNYKAEYIKIEKSKNPSVENETLDTHFNSEYETLRKLLETEYRGGKSKEFYKQCVRSCIEKADIHISYRTENETDELNAKILEKMERTTPYFSWEMQLLKYLALIEQPGIVTPSPEERCMQLAFTAKYNSGCISRQVGATITDDFYSVKAIGWNNTPEGHVPCLLRNAEVLLESSDEELAENEDVQSSELRAFTPYEKTDKQFNMVLRTNYESQIKNNKELLNGRNVSFCFKALKNSCSEGKNQVHTRSLHAEESAFLQITKYGGTGIKDGKLFTTSSPCELCSKKAYQLGIKVIYYIDPYPGISQEQILQAGSNKPTVRLFNGAIGNVYHWLYEPFMAYKDELALILEQDIQDLTSQHAQTIEELSRKNKALVDENTDLKRRMKLKQN